MDVKSFDDIKSLIEFLKFQSESNLLIEICGMVGLNDKNQIIYLSFKNRSPEPDKFFIVDPYDYLNFIKSFKPICFFHSHIYGDEKPSSFDEKSSENSCLAFLIYSVTSEKFFIYEPQIKKYDVTIVEGIRKSYEKD